eukprot:CAMPEP_0119329448 /NCGR_PEP_ID=MMETSP1333-20130426/75885_1 /TAXON_ID=418940 /ORGANISM="Scyphosphaera apsteinii, Strain RCC1455" /LENGTH=247 /DNA_ID=CAMNT_0007338569 /DNA_START=20 /DNA_END=763 /DNA_ORIENTATION=+
MACCKGDAWTKQVPVSVFGDTPYGQCVAQCEAHVQRGFLKKVFGLVSTQLAVTALLSALFMLVPSIRDWVLHSPSMLLVTFVGALVFLFASHLQKDNHPTNLYCLAGFTISMAWSVGVTCAQFYAVGLGLLVLEAVAITASVTVGLTAFALNSKADFSYLGAGLGASLWVLIFGGFIATLTGLPAAHLALAVGGAAVFSLYIVYDVYLISRRMSPDEYISASISLYLDIINLFLHILRIVSELSGRD